MKTFTFCNEFIKKYKNKQIPSLSVQKLHGLLWFSNAWHLKVNGSELFQTKFYREKWGCFIPVVDSMFKHHDEHGWWHKVVGVEKSIDDYLYFKIHENFESRSKYLLNKDDDIGLMEAIVNRYGKCSSKELNYMMTLENSAWLMGTYGTMITNDEILKDTTIN